MAEQRSNKGEVNTDGYYYQLFTMMHCIDRLRKSKQVVKYTIGNAIQGYGALDDVVFDAELDNNERIITAIQVKHSNKMIDENYLCIDKRSFLYKYLESFMKIEQTVKRTIETSASPKQHVQLILWTNMAIAKNTLQWFDELHPDDKCYILDETSKNQLEYKSYKIKSGQIQEIIEKNHNAVRIANNKKGDKEHEKKKEQPIEEWQRFFEHFVLYVEVEKVDELKACLMESIGDYFDDLCKLLESHALKKMTTKDQIDRMYSLVRLRHSMETNPYIKLNFTDLDGLQSKVMPFIKTDSRNLLFVKACQDVDCSVARLITVVKKCLIPKYKSYLVVNYTNFNEIWETELRPIIDDRELSKEDLKCLIISSANVIEDQELLEIENKLPYFKVIFVGSELNIDSAKKINVYCLDDDFDINCLDDSIKSVIKNRSIQLSQWQNVTTLDEIFCSKLFQKENTFMILELYRLNKNSILQITVSEPSCNTYYQSRVAKLSSECNNTMSVDLLNQTDFPKLVIHDQAGMGKTTEMVKLANDFREKYPDHLVVYLHCQAAVQRIAMDPTDSLGDLICNTVTVCNGLTNHIIKKIIQLGKLILIMDGYDEVSQEYNNKLKSVVSEASRAGIFKLYIATRPHCRDEINNILGECGLCHLEPFSKDDQLEYLKRVWKIKKSNNKDTVIETNIRSIINHFQNMTDGESFIGIPLQTYMIAVIYKDRISTPNFHVSESHSLGFMYKEFVDLKFMENAKRHYDPTKAAHAKNIKNLKTAFWKDHVVASLTIDKSYQTVTGLDCVFEAESEQQDEKEPLCERIEPYGIVMTAPSVSFIHYSYLEYFLARYILNYAMDINLMKYYISRYVDRYDSLVYRFMDYLLEKEIDRDVELNRSLYKSNSSDGHIADYTAPTTARLHPDKMKEFNAALNGMDALIITNLFSSLIYHRFFNLLEVIYDSLQLEIKTQVRLCLDAVRCRHSKGKVCFHLKNSKCVEALIPILKILFKKNPDTFFTLYFSGRNFSYELDHYQRIDSLLELMCDPKCSKLFDWLKDVIPKLDTKQQAALKLITRRHLDKCLMQVMRHENVEILDGLIIWAQAMWTPESTNQFLTNLNFLRYFVKNIEFSISESSERKRVEMVRKAFNFYHWAFRGEIPLNIELITAFSMIKTSSINESFQNLFQFN